MFLSLIEKRRSIRKFLDQDVESAKVEILIESALRAPSSMGRNPWEFVIVRDRELLGKLSKSKPHGASFLKNAPLGIVVCADPAKCDVWIEDASIATIFLLLAAESIGLGGCWIQVRERMNDEHKTSKAYISEILNIPENLEIEAIVAAGYPDEQKPSHLKEELLYGKLHYGRFGEKTE